jgi:hypothetical protein
MYHLLTKYFQTLYQEINQRNQEGFYGKLACLASQARSDHL